MLTDALSYPIRGTGWMMILLGAIFSIILDVLQFAPVIGIAVALFSAGYFSSFYLEIINTTMTDRDIVPEWPNISSFIDDIISPFIRVFGLVIISFIAPFALLFADQSASWFIPAMVAAVIFSCFYFPMAALAAQAFGSLGSALPHIVFPAIFRARSRYLVAVIALVVTFIVCGLAQEFAVELPYVGWFLAASIALYSLMFQARLIGLIYRNQSDKFEWE